MAIVHILSLTIFILFLASANGRSSLQPFSFTNLKVEAVSRAASSYTTNYTDVLGLGLLATAFPLLAFQEGIDDDPCVAPVWSWIECNSDATPRVIALNLNNQNLFGLLPDFSSMDALQRIDLSQNALYQIIPSFLGTFPHLQELNLASNLFYGMVPDSIACNNNLKLNLDANAGLTVSNKCSKNFASSSPPATSFSGGGGGSISGVPSRTRTKKKSNLPGILGGTISAFVVLWVGVGAYAIHRHKAKTAAVVAQASAKPEPSEASPSIAMEEMPINARATTNMSP